MIGYKTRVLSYLFIFMTVPTQISGTNSTSKTVVSVQKCCQADELVNFYDGDGSGFCMLSGNVTSGWKPRFYDENLNPIADHEYEHLDVRFRDDIISWTFGGDSRCPEIFDSSTPAYYLLKNGSLAQEGYPTTQEYCIDHARIEPGVIETILLRCTTDYVDYDVVVEPTKISRTNSTGKTVVNVQKCCQTDRLVNFYYNDDPGFCMLSENVTSGWKPRFYDENLNPVADHEYEHLDVRFRDDIISWSFAGDSRCPEIIEANTPAYYLLKNGSLAQEGYPATQVYCIDHARIEPGVIETILMRCSSKLVKVKCRSDCDDDDFDVVVELVSNSTNACWSVEHGQVIHYVYMFFMITSIVFLIITFIVYIIIPDLKNLHGKIVVSNVTSIFLFTVYLLVVYIFKFERGSLSCVVFGYIGYFLLISMFGWLTIICFDLCWTFLRTKAPKKGGEVIKFTMYALFVYSLTIILTITVFIFDHFYPKESPYNPKVGAESCFIHPEAMGIFVHIPILIIMIANSILYIITTTTLYKAKTSTKGARTSRRTNADSGEIHNEENKTKKKYIRIQKDTIEQLVLYTKLFLVMGVLWICEAIHYYVHRCHYDDSSITPSEIFFRIIDAINLLRGFIFFLIFVCKGDILKKLGKLPIFIKVFGRRKAAAFGSRSNTSSNCNTNSTKSTTTNRSKSLTSSICKSNQNSFIVKTSTEESTNNKEEINKNTFEHMENANQVEEVQDEKHTVRNGGTRKISFDIDYHLDMKNSKDVMERESFLENQSQSPCI